MIIEGANSPTTPAADEILHDKGVYVIPDVMANAGGVVCSYFEWVQNLQHFRWDEREVNDKLGGIMRRAYRDVSTPRQGGEGLAARRRLPGRDRAGRRGLPHARLRLAAQRRLLLVLEVEVLRGALLEPEVLLVGRRPRRSRAAPASRSSAVLASSAVRLPPRSPAPRPGRHPRSSARGRVLVELAPRPRARRLGARSSGGAAGASSLRVGLEVEAARGAVARRRRRSSASAPAAPRRCSGPRERGARGASASLAAVGCSSSESARARGAPRWGGARAHGRDPAARCRAPGAAAAGRALPPLGSPASAGAAPARGSGSALGTGSGSVASRRGRLGAPARGLGGGGSAAVAAGREPLPGAAAAAASIASSWAISSASDSDSGGGSAAAPPPRRRAPASGSGSAQPRAAADGSGGAGRAELNRRRLGGGLGAGAARRRARGSGASGSGAGAGAASGASAGGAAADACGLREPGRLLGAGIAPRPGGGGGLGEAARRRRRGPAGRRVPKRVVLDLAKLGLPAPCLRFRSRCSRIASSRMPIVRLRSLQGERLSAAARGDTGPCAILHPADHACTQWARSVSAAPSRPRSRGCRPRPLRSATWSLPGLACAFAAGAWSAASISDFDVAARSRARSPTPTLTVTCTALAAARISAARTPLAQALGQDRGSLRPGLKQHERELVAAVAGRDVDRAGGRARHDPTIVCSTASPARCPYRSLICLKSSDVDDQQRELMPEAQRALDLALQLLVQAPAVREPGEWVGDGLLGDLRVQPGQPASQHVCEHEREQQEGREQSSHGPARSPAAPRPCAGPAAAPIRRAPCSGSAGARGTRPARAPGRSSPPARHPARAHPPLRPAAPRTRSPPARAW